MKGMKHEGPYKGQKTSGWKGMPKKNSGSFKGGGKKPATKGAVDA